MIKSQVQQQVKQQFKTASGLSPQQLKKFDYGSLSKQQLQIFQKLGQLTGHKYLLKVISDQFGQTRLKEQYILDNFASLTQDQISQFNQAKMSYNNKIKIFPTTITVSTTLGAFVYGLWTLPARKKLVKHTTFGFLTGATLSYFYWRYQSNKFNNAMNIQFKNALRDRYNSEKKRQR